MIYDHWINIGAIIRSSGNTQFNFWKENLMILQYGEEH